MKRRIRILIASLPAALSVIFIATLCASVIVAWSWHRWLEHASGQAEPWALRTSLLESEAVEKWIDLGFLVRQGFANELLDPGTTLPQMHRLPREALKLWLEAERTCIHESLVDDGSLGKLPQWIRAICTKTEIPTDFWETPPFMHPSGVSYATLTLNNGLQAPALRQHVLEVAVDLLDPSMRPHIAALQQMSWETLWRLHIRKPVFEDHNQNRVFLRDQGSLGEVRYAVFMRSRLDTYTRARGLALLHQSQANACDLREVDFCWTQVNMPAIPWGPPILAAFVFFVVVVSISIAVLTTFGKSNRRSRYNVV